MMINWYFIAIVSISATTYAIDLKDICEQGPRACVTERHRTTDFPGTPSELDEFCELAIEFLTCQAEYADICMRDHPERSNPFWATVTSTQNICDKDGEIYNGLATHIACFKDTLQNLNQTCRKSAYHLTMNLEEKDNLEEEDYAKIGCLRRSLEVACIILKVEETCGVSGEQAFVAFIDELKKIIDYCESLPIENIRSLSNEVEMDEALRDKLLAFLNKK